jgi:hypothetical protein
MPSSLNVVSVVTALSHLICTMSDDSEWQCELDGSNFIRIRAGTTELTQIFHEQGH